MFFSKKKISKKKTFRILCLTVNHLKKKKTLARKKKQKPFEKNDGKPFFQGKKQKLLKKTKNI